MRHRLFVRAVRVERKCVATLQERCKIMVTLREGAAASRVDALGHHEMPGHFAPETRGWRVSSPPPRASGPNPRGG